MDTCPDSLLMVDLSDNPQNCNALVHPLSVLHIITPSFRQVYRLVLNISPGCIAQGVIYGSRSSKDATSTIMYRPFDSWAANSDWQVSLPQGEEATAVTAGHSFSVVATSQHMLRIFSPAGEKEMHTL